MQVSMHVAVHLRKAAVLALILLNKLQFLSFSNYDVEFFAFK